MVSLVLYGVAGLMTTPDAALVSIDARTGKQRWRAPNGDPAVGFQHTGGPVVAQGVVISGLKGCERFKKESCALIGRDTESGSELWRTASIGLPGQPGGETCGGLAPEFRAETRRSSWRATVGTYL